MDTPSARDVAPPLFGGELMNIESVSDCGDVVVRFPAGWGMQFSISLELVPYYRRLIRRGAAAAERELHGQPRALASR